MVKGQIRIVADASYESQSRTVLVSEKPYGMPVVPVVQISGKYVPEFSSERMIHGKIREFTLRSASHWNAVHKAVETHSASLQVQNGGQDANRGVARDELVMIAQMLNDKALRAVDFPLIQKGLREFVFAHMIRGSADVPRVSVAGVSTNSLTHGVKNSQASHVELKKTFITSIMEASKASHNKLLVNLMKASSINSVTNLSSKDISANIDSSRIGGLRNADSKIGGFASSASIRGNDMNSHWTRMHGSSAAGSREDVSLLMCLLISCGHLNVFIKDMRSKHGHKRVAVNDSFAKLGMFSLNSRKCGTLSHPIAQKDVSGFGTAPIWYQQSMATGPPRCNLAGFY